MEGFQPATLISALALFVSLLVFGVQHGQWRTARLKVAVDLFDRRFKVLTAIEDSLVTVMQHGEVSTQAFNDFARAQFDAQYLFGRKVQKYLQHVRQDLAWMQAYRDIHEANPKREKLIEEKYKRFNRLTDFFKDAPKLFLPYIGLQQRIKPRFWD